MYIRPCDHCGKSVLETGFVTVQAAEFETVLAKAKAFDAAQSATVSFRRFSRTDIARYPDVARHILECGKTMIAREIRASCIAKFGKSRAPSISAIYRFLNDLSKADFGSLNRLAEPNEPFAE